MTPKDKAKHGKSADTVAVEAQEIDATLLEQPDFLQPVVQEAVQAILEMEMEECLQTGKHDRTGDRQGYRSGYYRRRLITRGDVGLASAAGSERRLQHRAVRAIPAHRAGLGGGYGTDVCPVVTQELCGREFSASSISAITRRLEEQLAQFSQRPLEVEYP